MRSLGSSPQAARLSVSQSGRARINGSHLLVAAGRRADLEALDLAAAGIAAMHKGLIVDGGCAPPTAAPLPSGDAAGGPQFTHVAAYHAGIVIRNALFRLPAKVDYRALPWVHLHRSRIGPGRHRPRRRRDAHRRRRRVLRWPYHENDRAQTERETAGLVKVVTRRNGRILGASILGADAGELIQPWVLAIAQGSRSAPLANLIAPYPTRGEVSKRAAGSFYTRRLFCREPAGLCASWPGSAEADRSPRC